MEMKMKMKMKVKMWRRWRRWRWRCGDSATHVLFFHFFFLQFLLILFTFSLCLSLPLCLSLSVYMFCLLGFHGIRWHLPFGTSIQWGTRTSPILKVIFFSFFFLLLFSLCRNGDAAFNGDPVFNGEGEILLAASPTDTLSFRIGRRKGESERRHSYLDWIVVVVPNPESPTSSLDWCSPSPL